MSHISELVDALDACQYDGVTLNGSFGIIDTQRVGMPLGRGTFEEERFADGLNQLKNEFGWKFVGAIGMTLLVFVKEPVK